MAIVRPRLRHVNRMCGCARLDPDEPEPQVVMV